MLQLWLVARAVDTIVVVEANGGVATWECPAMPANDRQWQPTNAKDCTCQKAVVSESLGQLVAACDCLSRV